jgi:transmembrane sensor
LENSKLKQLFRQYLLGKAPEPQSRVLNRWYESFDHDPPLELSEYEETQLGEEIWQKVKPAGLTAKRIYIRVARVAAVVLLAVGAGIVFWPKQKLSYTEIVTIAGERKTIALKDGSTMTVNAGSTIRFKDRQVQIQDGEVFFEVATNAGTPFQVESGPVTTTVLGTSFNVSAYQHLHTLEVGVVSGKVLVKSSNTENIVEKGQSLIYDKNHQKAVLSGLTTPAWQQGKLLLNDVSFDEMVILMQKNFGINIIAEAETVKSTRYTTELSTVMEPLKAAQVLAAIHGLKVKTRGTDILIYE